MSDEPSKRLAAAEAERDAARQQLVAREGILNIVAHDLRGPLSLVKMGAGMLDRMCRGEHLEGPKVQEVATSLASAVRRMERMIADLLDLEALDQGSLRIVKASVDAVRVVDEVAQEMRALAEPKGVEVVAERPKHAIVVNADRDRIAQVLENLASNAIRHTPSGKRVTLRVVAKGGEARFEVIDQGPGISEHDLRHIFEPFFRSTTVKGRGLGLGLSIALGLVRAHDGALWAESEPGHGATFVFAMPQRLITRDTIEMRAIDIPGLLQKLAK